MVAEPCQHIFCLLYMGPISFLECNFTHSQLALKGSEPGFSQAIILRLSYRARLGYKLSYTQLLECPFQLLYAIVLVACGGNSLASREPQVADQASQGILIGIFRLHHMREDGARASVMPNEGGHASCLIACPYKRLTNSYGWDRILAVVALCMND